MKKNFKPLPESLNVKSIVFSVKIPFKNNESSQNGIPTLSSYGEHPKWVFNK